MADSFDLFDSPRANDAAEPMTGQQIRDVNLPDARFGTRGYDKTSVRRLLSRLAADVDNHLKAAQALQVSANAMAVEVAHRRGGYLPDHSLADLRIAAQVESIRHSEDVISAAQIHARDLVDAARQQAAALSVQTDRDDDIATLRRRLYQYQQLAHTMNNYLQHIVGVLANAHTSFVDRFAIIDSADQPTTNEQSI